jgi:hypothetical protein
MEKDNQENIQDIFKVNELISIKDNFRLNSVQRPTRGGHAPTGV